MTMSFPDKPDVGEPTTLYHYTTQEGLLGILNSGYIWATKIQFMNDATEFRTAIDTVDEELRSRSYEIDSTEERARFEAISTELLDIESTDVFVVSLTEEGDQLSQWRAYSGRHSGFALGFDVARLRAVSSEHAFSLAQCIYDHDACSIFTKILIDNAFLWLSAGARMTRRRRREFRRLLLRMAPLFKHYTFGEELEWRLFSTSHPVTAQSVEFRAGPSTIVPYYKLPLHAPDGTSALSSITVGPTPHPELSIDSVHALAAARGFGGISVDQSRIPLRTW